MNAPVGNLVEGRSRSNAKRRIGRYFYAPVSGGAGACHLTQEVTLLSEQDVTRLQEQMKTLFGDVTELKDDVKEIKAQLANRLPLWATVLISVLTAFIGWLLAGGGM